MRYLNSLPLLFQFVSLFLKKSGAIFSKSFSITLLFILFFVSFTSSAHAFQGGNGTSANPYQIATCQQLQSVKDSSMTAHYELVQNIDCSMTATWNEGAGFEPIDGFNGVFEGNNRVITGLTIYRPSTENIGLFGGNSSSHTPIIRNLRMEQATIEGLNQVGGVAGRLYGTVINTSFSGDVTGNGDRVGGLIGQPFNATIDQVVAVGTVTGSGTMATRDIGGLTGRASGTTNIGVAYTRSTVSGGQYVGGIMGSSSTTISSFSQMYSASVVTGAVTSSGAIVGIIENSGDTFSSIYFDSQLAGNSTGTNSFNVNISGMVGLPTANMQGSAATTNLVGFNFDDIWVAVTVPTNDYPVFFWQSGGLVTVSGVVTHALTGNPIADIQVQAVPDDANFGTVTTQTDENGAYSFQLYTSPMYTISATHIFDGFEVTDNETISPNQTTEVDLVLTYQFDGSGTQADPYQITNAIDLQQMRYYLDAYYQVQNAIDMTESHDWFGSTGFLPIGTSSTPFTGTLDGQGNVISNLQINQEDMEYVGLFSHLTDATVQNIYLSNISVMGGTADGGAGGLVGLATNSTIHRVAVASYTGNVSHVGSVSSQGRAGGLVGMATGSSTGVGESFSQADVQSDLLAGGLVGRLQDQAQIQDSFATGLVQSGIAGGLVASVDTATITRSHAVGTINGGEDQSIGDTTIGGLVGQVSSATISHSFWNQETTGQSQSTGTGAVSKTTVQMSDASTFTTEIEPNDWDFLEVWGIFGTHYPVLRAFYELGSGEFRIANYGSGQATSNFWYRGFRFRVSQLTVVTHLVGGGDAGNFDIGLYTMVMNGDKVRPTSIIASVTATGSTAQQVIALDTPVILYPNTDYVLAQGRSSGSGSHHNVSNLDVQDLLDGSPRINFWMPDSSFAYRWGGEGPASYIVNLDHQDPNGFMPLMGFFYETHVILPVVQTVSAAMEDGDVALGADLQSTGNGPTTLFVEVGQNSNLSDGTLYSLGEFEELVTQAHQFDSATIGTLYYYRAVAINEAGRSNGSTLSFQTRSLTYTAGAGGSISGQINQVALQGGSGTTVTAVANEGYSFVGWSDGVAAATRQDMSISGNVTVIANFALAPILGEVEIEVLEQTDLDPDPDPDPQEPQNSTPGVPQKAVISWTTNANTSSQVLFGLLSTLTRQTPEQNTDIRVTEHTIELLDLEPCARYYYKVRSVDNFGAYVESSTQSLITNGCQFSSVADGVEEEIPTQGGTISYTYGGTQTELVIPHNFSSSSATFQINALHNTGVPTPPSGKKIASNAFFRLLAVDADNQAITSFDEPLSFTVSYTKNAVQSVQENTLKLYKYSSGQWIAQECSVNTQAQTVTCTLPTFSTYILAGEAKATEDTKSKSHSDTKKATVGAPLCSDLKPVGIPEIFEITTTSTTAIVSFTPVGGVDTYFISYSTSEHAEEHGFEYKGTSYGVQQPLIRDLLPNSTYYFKVRPQNGCMAGDWSVPFSTSTVLHAQSGVFGRVSRFGDQLFGATGMQIESIKKTNIESTDEVEQTESEEEVTELSTGLYTVRIKVENDGEAIGGVAVELHSNPKYGVTDENGEVIFKEVEAGKHTLKLAYQDYIAEQHVIVDGEETEFAVTVQVTFQQKDGILSTNQWIFLLILTGILTATGVYLLTRNSTQ